MLDLLPSGCDILATHPMFGPDSCPDTNWSGFNFVYDPIKITDDIRYNNFLDIFRDTNLIKMECPVHDIITSKSQFITHLIGQLLGKLGIESTQIDTTSYQLLLDVKHITNNDSCDLFKGLYQYNPNSKYQVSEFKKVLEEILIFLEYA